MLRLAHRILAQKPVESLLDRCEPRMYESNRNGVVMAQLMLASGGPVIVADNIADYVTSKDNYQSGPVLRKPSDFPPCPPAFQHCFIEFNYPRSLSTLTGNHALQGGAMLYAHSVDDPYIDDRVKAAKQEHPNAVVLLYLGLRHRTRWFRLCWGITLS